MARLRTYDNTRVAPQQGGGVAVSAPDVRAGEFAAEQLQQAGRAVQTAARTASALLIDQVEKQNEIRVTEALTEAQRRMMAKQTEFSQLQGADALTPGEDGVPPAL